MTTYREAIRTALAVHADYRRCAASEHYDAPLRAIDSVQWATYWYGEDPRVFDYDEHADAYYVADRRTYRTLSVLLRVAPIGGRSYLGMPLRTALTASVLAMTIGAAATFALPTPTVFDQAAALAECAKTNGADLTPDACYQYLAWMDATAECRAADLQEDYERCAAAFPTR